MKPWDKIRLNKVASRLTDQTQTLTELGAVTGYTWEVLAVTLNTLKKQGRAKYKSTGWVRVQNYVSA